MIVHNYVDAVIGLQYGDEGKGKITQSLVSQGNYEVCARFNGGPNAGHTIYHEGKKLVNHQLPTSILFKGVKSYIGPGCVLDWGGLEDELEENRAEFLKRLWISPRVPLISIENKEGDDYKGSTKRGIAPAYGDFYARKSALAGELSLFYNDREIVEDIEECGTLLLEGAQGFYLDPWHGAYPWTSSSLVLPAAAAATFGFDPRKIRNVYGVAKPYETAVGYHPKFGKEQKDSFMKLQQIGEEFGATTGRVRQVQYLNVDRLIKSLLATTTTHLIFNKCDVFKSVEDFSYMFQGEVCTFNSFQEWYEELQAILFNYCDDLRLIKCFGSPYPEKI